MSLTDVASSLSVRDRASAFYDFASQPIRHATLFYTTYWLADVKEIDEARFDFNRLRDKSHAAFLDYGIYSVVGEVANVYSAFSVADEIILNLPAEGSIMAEESRWTDDEIGVMIDHFFEVYAEKRDVIGPRSAEQPRLGSAEKRLIKAIFENAGGVRRIQGETTTLRSSVVKACNFAEVQWDAFTEPEPFLRACQRLFNFGYHKTAETGWHTNYGGPAWAAICRHLLRADEYPPTAWVDTSWGIQHNNANWMNKITPADAEIDHLTHIADFPRIGNRTRWVYDIALPKVLDWNKNGEWDNLYPLAWTYDGFVGVDLRRLARALGIDLPPGKEAILHTTPAGGIERIGPPKHAELAQTIVGELPREDVEGNRLTMDGPAGSTWGQEFIWELQNGGGVIEVGDTITVQNILPAEASPSTVDVLVEITETDPEGPVYVDSTATEMVLVDGETGDPVS